MANANVLPVIVALVTSEDYVTDDVSEVIDHHGLHAVVTGDVQHR